MAFQPLPDIEGDAHDFWTGGAEGELRIHRCGECRTWFHPPAPVCPDCLSMNVAAEAASGTATVASYTTNHQPWLPDMEVPYVVAIVEIDDNPEVRLMTRLVDIAPEEVAIGQAVEVTFDHHEDVWIPLFRPAGADTGGAE